MVIFASDMGTTSSHMKNWQVVAVVIQDGIEEIRVGVWSAHFKEAGGYKTTPATDTHNHTRTYKDDTTLSFAPVVARHLGRSYLARLDTCYVTHDKSVPRRSRAVACGDSLRRPAALEHEPRGGSEQAEREDQRDLGVPTHGKARANGHNTVAVPNGHNTVAVPNGQHCRCRAALTIFPHSS